jgi:glutathione S-transferase
MCPYGDYDTMFNTLVDQLRKGPYILGERFSAADLLWGLSLRWMTGFKIVEALPEVMAYVQRVESRPSFAKVTESDARLMAEHQAAVAS